MQESALCAYDDRAIKLYLQLQYFNIEGLSSYETVQSIFAWNLKTQATEECEQLYTLASGTTSCSNHHQLMRYNQQNKAPSIARS